MGFWLNFAKVCLAGFSYTAVLTVAYTVLAAFFAGGQIIVYINKFGEQWLDLAFVAVAVPGGLYALTDYANLRFEANE